MSTELKEAAQQALKELGEARKIVRASQSRQLAKDWDRRATDALANLRTAIQQAEAQQPATGEPVAWLHVCRKKPELRELSFSKAWPNLAALGYKARPLVLGDTHPAPSVPNLIEKAISSGYFDVLPVKATIPMCKAGWAASGGELNFQQIGHIYEEMYKARPLPDDAIYAAPSAPDGLQWFTVAEHGLPEVGEVVVGGLWYTDPWLKPECATSFMWGQCRVVNTKHRDFKDGKQWLTFGPSHNQITHWARLNPPATLAAKERS